MEKDTCIYFRTYYCAMKYNCIHKDDECVCKLSGKIKTWLVYIPKNIRPDDSFAFKNKYTLDGIGI